MKILSILRKLHRDKEASVFFAGEGAIDYLKRRKSNYYELVVQNLPLHEVENYLRKHFPARAVRDNGSSLFVHANGVSVMIRSPREGIQSNPYASLKKDAATVGLSVLALYVPIGESKDRHFSFFGADKDIKERRIRVIGKGMSIFKRDPSIMLSAISLAMKYNYKLDSNLIRAIRKVSIRVNEVNHSVVRSLLTTIMLNRKPSKFLRLLHSCGLLEELMPELTACIGIPQQARYHKYDVFDHCLVACDSAPRQLSLRFAALLHDVGKAPTRAYVMKEGSNVITFYNHEVAGAKIASHILKRFEYPKAIVTEVSDLIYHHMYNYVSDKWSDTAVKRFIERAGITKADLDDLSNHPLFLLRKADRAASGRIDMTRLSGAQVALEKKIREEFEKEGKITVKDLEIDGTTLMEVFHLKEGPTVGNVLRYLLEKVMELPSRNNREYLIEEASNYLSAALK